jgi:hypothetical protein
MNISRKFRGGQGDGGGGGRGRGKRPSRGRGRGRGRGGEKLLSLNNMKFYELRKEGFFSLYKISG